MLPNQLNFMNSVEASQGRSYKSNIQPQSGSSFKPSETIIINIPTRNNIVLSPSESYLRGKVSFKNGAVTGAESSYIRLPECGSHALFYRLQLYHGSNLLESIENYPLLAKLMYDLQLSTNQTAGKQSILAGTSTEYVVGSSVGDIATGAVAADIVTALQATKNVAKYNNVGRRLNSGQIALNETVTMDFSINLISLIGSLSSKYIPLFEMSSAPLRLELQLVSNPLDAVISHKALATDGNAMVLSDVEFVAQIIELSDSAISIIKNNTGSRPLQFTYGGWKNYRWSQSVAGKSSTNIAMPIPAKFASLKSLFILTKRSTATGVITAFPLISEKFYLSSYQFRIGPQLLPSKPCTLISEMFAETLKAIGSLSDINHSPAIDFDTFNIDITDVSTETVKVLSTKTSSSFIIGIDLENYSGSDRSQMFSGSNTTSDDIFYNAIYGGNAGNADSVNLTLDCFANFDCVVCFENGGAFVKY